MSTKPQGPRLDLKQTQSMTMTPQLRQAIALLQLNNIELDAHLRNEIQSNPFLEMDDGQNKNQQTTSDSEPSSEQESATPISKEDHLDADYSNVWQDDNNGTPSEGSMNHISGSGSHQFNDTAFSYENTLPEKPSLYNHLSEQIAIDMPEAAERVIAYRLVESLSESGYYTGDLSKVAEELACPKEDVEDILAKLQNMDPAGIFARDLSECLAIQLKDRDRYSPPMQKLIANLDLIEKHDFKKLMSACDIDELTLRALMAEIRTLNPKPGLEFADLISQTLIPDVYVRRKKDKNADLMWAIELNNETLPKVLINQTYYAEVKKSPLQKDESQYLTDRFNAANWIARALDQRAQTILKVSTEIVKQQEAFFLYGVQYLKPLVLRDIAKECELHESTVSRVTTNKYMSTSRGVYELKFFFSASLGGNSGGMTHAAQAVKARIKELIDNEDPKKVLSDDAIVETLTKEGIDIARRTVAKYREAMKIGSSVQRRREKKAAL